MGARLERRADLPHVTDVLARAGLIDTEWFRSYDLARGKALHLAAQYLDEGDLDWGKVDPVISGRLRAYQRFLDECRPEIISVEKPVENRLYGYCGTLDRLLRLSGRYGVLDIKGPSAAAWQGIQVAAYAACLPDPPHARWTLHLSDDGYKLVEHKDRTDWEAFKAALTLSAWKDRHGIK